MKVNYSFVSPSGIEEVRTETSVLHKVERELQYSVIEHATIVPADRFLYSGVLDSQGNTVVSGAFNELFQVRKIAESESVICSDKVVVFIGILHNVWGHCLTDSLKKVWFLQTVTCKKLIENGVKVVYLLPDNEDIKPYALHFYQLAGLDLTSFEAVKSSTRFEKVIVPDNSLVCERSQFNQWRLSYTQEFEDILSAIKKKLITCRTSHLAEYDKIYLTRTGVAANDREYGEKDIEKIFRSKGFKVISPEKYSFEEQFSLLSNCKEMAATEGSISHNALFCRPGTKLYLIRKSNYVNGYQTIINEIADLDVTYIDAHCSLPEVQYAAMYGPFYMCVTPELERFVGHRITHLPRWLHPSWWWYKNHNRKIVHWLARVFKLPYF